jgi:hypothetical protein
VRRGAYEKERVPVTQTNTSTTPTDTTTTPSDSPPPPPPGPVVDTTAPVVKLLLGKQRLPKALKKGYAGAFNSNEAGVAKPTLFLKKMKVASGRLSASAPGKLRLAAKFARKAKKSLAKQRKVRLRLVLVMTDKAGNSTRKTATVTLKR